MEKIGFDKVKHAVVCLAITIAVAFAIIGVTTWYETQVCDLNPVRKGNVGYMYDSINGVLHDLDGTINTYVLGADK